MSKKRNAQNFAYVVTKYKVTHDEGILNKTKEDCHRTVSIQKILCIVPHPYSMHVYIFTIGVHASYSINPMEYLEEQSRLRNLTSMAI